MKNARIMSETRQSRAEQIEIFNSISESLSVEYFLVQTIGIWVISQRIYVCIQQLFTTLDDI